MSQPEIEKIAAEAKFIIAGWSERKSFSSF